MYFNSDQVIVYPASNRLNNSRAIYTSETNLTNPLRIGNSFESYLIKYEAPTDENSGLLEFILGGYYFKINLTQEDINGLNSGDNYLGLFVMESEGSEEDLENGTFLNLSNFSGHSNSLDVDNKFLGLYIDTADNYDTDLENKPRGHKDTRGAIDYINYIGILYWLKVGKVEDSNPPSKTLEIDSAAYIRYDKNHLGVIENNIIKRIPQITTMSVSEFNEGGRMNFPLNPEKGDILIVYNDESVPIPN